MMRRTGRQVKSHETLNMSLALFWTGIWRQAPAMARWPGRCVGPRDRRQSGIDCDCGSGPSRCHKTAAKCREMADNL